MTTLLGKQVKSAQIVETRKVPRILRAILWGYTGLAVIIATVALAHPLVLPEHPVAVVTSIPNPYNLSGLHAASAFGQVIADTTTTTTSTSTSSAQCTPIPSDFNISTIFPILTTSILSSSTCSPPYWSLTIFKILAYKALGLLNYIIAVAALLLTVYAGILYLTGFSNEKNVSTAKTVLMSTYIGLIISLSATLILRATISIVPVDDSTSQAALSITSPAP